MAPGTPGAGPAEKNSEGNHSRHPAQPKEYAMTQLRNTSTLSALRPRRRMLAGVAALGALSVVVVPTAFATTSTSSTVYYACASKTTGALRQVGASTACKNTETRSSWNQQGVPGTPGKQGTTGATGPAGATGATGPAGAIGATGPAGAMGATGPAGAPGVSGYQAVSSTSALPGLTAAEFRSYCPAGEQVLGGGYTSDVNVQNSAQVTVVGAEPVDGTPVGDYYTVTLANFQAAPGAESAINVTVTATCATTTAGSAAAAGGAAAASRLASESRPGVVNLQRITAVH